MSWSHGGDFTKNLLSLQLQLKTLLEGVGGEDTAAIRNALENMESFEGAVGEIKKPFSATDHEAFSKENIFIAMWQDGKITKVD